jgi:endonuclease/exonuclease/phosphatase family metal-dependent hydrolase
MNTFVKDANVINFDKIKLKSKNTIRFMSFNVHGFTSASGEETLEKIIEQIKIIDPDIFGIQEIHLGCPHVPTMRDYSEKFNAIGYNVKFSKCWINMIGSKFDFEMEELSLSVSDSGRTHRCALIGKNFKIKTSTEYEYLLDIVFLSTHLEVFDVLGKHRINQMEKIMEHMSKRYSDSSIVVVGDFNSLRKSDYSEKEWNRIIEIDEKRGIETKEDVIPIIENAGYIDSFVDSNTFLHPVSVWTNRRVDYVYGRNVTFSQTEIVRTGLSDHYPIYADTPTE